MSGEKPIVSWDQLEDVQDAFTKSILLPNISESLGHEVYCKIRAIEALEIVKAFNFPLGEIDQMVVENAESEKFVEALQEHAKTFTVTELMETMQEVIRVGMVEPDPTSGNLMKMSRDFETIFGEIVAMTIPKEAAEQAGRFPADRE